MAKSFIKVLRLGTSIGYPTFWIQYRESAWHMDEDAKRNRPGRSYQILAEDEDSPNR